MKTRWVLKEYIHQQQDNEEYDVNKEEYNGSIGWKMFNELVEQEKQIQEIKNGRREVISN